MKNLLVQYAKYNLWANKQLLSIAGKLSSEQQQQIIASSFSSVHTTIVHLLDAESIWWQRLKLQEPIIIPSVVQNNLTTNEMINELLNSGEQWLTWINAAKENQLEHVFAYQNSKKEQFKQPVWQMLLHLFNHGTYHRGQLVTMYNQLGIQKIPATDFIYWSRTVK